MSTIRHSEDQLNVIFLFPHICSHCHHPQTHSGNAALKTFVVDTFNRIIPGIVGFLVKAWSNTMLLKFNSLFRKILEGTESYQLQCCRFYSLTWPLTVLWRVAKWERHFRCGSVNWRVFCWLCLKQQVPYIYFLVCISASRLCCASMSFCSPCPSLILVLIIWPTSGQSFDVPVQLLGDDMMPVNNSTVPLCWTCVMPTELAQQAAYFRGCTILLLLLPSSGFHWELPGFTTLVSIPS